MSARAYARHRGIHHSSVLRAIQQGRITRRGDGKIDAKKADRQWEASTDQSKPLNSVTGKPKHRKKNGMSAPVEMAGAPEPSGNGMSQTARTYADARARREESKAKQAELEYARAVGRFRDVDEVKAAAYRAGRQSRDRLLAAPARLAPQVAAVTNVRKCRLILDEAMRELCAEIERLMEET
jgi:hypothetical protein